MFSWFTNRDHAKDRDVEATRKEVEKSTKDAKVKIDDTYEALTALLDLTLLELQVDPKLIEHKADKRPEGH